MNYEKLRIRSEKFLQDVGIDFRFDQRPKGFSLKGKQAFLITENDTMLVINSVPPNYPSFKIKFLILIIIHKNLNFRNTMLA